MSSTKMASSKRKQDEKHLKMLREMAAQPHNKQCFDCHQRGPTYVNMTIGSFVCTSCSGILRGLNPPHRVKSISMTSFTPDEMEFLKCHGNDFCRKVYLGLFDSRSGPEPDAREEQKVKDFMVQKYERKRWYVAPTDSMKEEAKQMNEAAMNKQPTTKPLKTLLGDNTPRLVVTNNQSPQPTKAPASTTVTVPTPTQLGTKPAQQDLSFQSPGTQSQSSQSSGSMTMDLLGDLGGDPFASGTAAPAPAPATVQGGSGGGFADFSSFNNQFTAPAHPNPPFQTSANPLLPLGSASSPAQAPNTANGSFLGTQPAAVAPPVSTGVAPLGGDKYASLADLFSDSPASSASTLSSSNTLNWSGDTGSSGMNWGGSSNNTAGSGISWDGSGVKNTPTSAGINWNNTPSTAGGGGGAVMNWNNATNSSGSSNMFQSPVISPAAELAPTGLPGNPFVCADTGGANPFGGGSTTVPAQNPMGGASNPFGAPSGGSLFGQQPTSSVGGFGTPAPNSAPGFGQPVGGFGHFGGAVPPSGMGSSQPASGATFGQFGMQNGGGFSSAGNTAVPGGGFGAFSQPQTMSNFGSGPSIAGQYDNKMAGMGGQPQGFPASMGGAGGWGQMQPAQQTANPFMSTASQPVAPKSSSNPFL